MIYRVNSSGISSEDKIKFNDTLKSISSNQELILKYFSELPDSVLDIIIGDYEALFKIIRDNEKEKEELNEQIVELKQQIRNLKTSIEIAKGASDNDTLGATNTNLDVMKRLAQLEKIVYGKDE